MMTVTVIRKHTSDKEAYKTAQKKKAKAKAKEAKKKAEREREAKHFGVFIKNSKEYVKGKDGKDVLYNPINCGNCDGRKPYKRALICSNNCSKQAKTYGEPNVKRRPTKIVDYDPFAFVDKQLDALDDDADDEPAADADDDADDESDDDADDESDDDADGSDPGNKSSNQVYQEPPGVKNQR
jgi:hypothetical protein